MEVFDRCRSIYPNIQGDIGTCQKFIFQLYIPMTFTPPDSYTTDLLSRQPFAEKMEAFILTEHDFVDGGLVVSLNAQFGSGKSKFIEMWSRDLRFRQKEQRELPTSVVINAWETDFCNDPLIAIISALSEALRDRDCPAYSETDANALLSAVKNVSAFTGALANGVIDHFTGANILDAAEAVKENAKEKSRKDTFNSVELFDLKKAGLKKLKDALKDVFGSEEPKAIIFIDELDRCRPDYAVHYLEVIKHIFDIHGIVFVLSVDVDQLRSAVRVLFGTEMNFEEYFRKFVHRSVELPQPLEQDLFKLVESYTHRFLSIQQKRSSGLEWDRHAKKNIVQLFELFRFSPRQAQEVFRTVGYALTIRQGSQLILPWCVGVATIYMAALRIANREIYEKIGNNTVTVDELGKTLDQMDRKKAEWWRCVIFTGVEATNQWRGAAIQYLIKMKVFGEGATEDTAVQHLNKFSGRGWDDSHMNNIYDHIEGMKNHIR